MARQKREREGMSNVNVAVSVLRGACIASATNRRVLAHVGIRSFAGKFERGGNFWTLRWIVYLPLQATLFSWKLGQQPSAGRLCRATDKCKEIARSKWVTRSLAQTSPSLFRVVLLRSTPFSDASFARVSSYTFQLRLCSQLWENSCIHRARENSYRKHDR